jgi:hypothetical protein
MEHRHFAPGVPPTEPLHNAGSVDEAQLFAEVDRGDAGAIGQQVQGVGGKLAGADDGGVQQEPTLLAAACRFGHAHLGLLKLSVAGFRTRLCFDAAKLRMLDEQDHFAATDNPFMRVSSTSRSVGSSRNIAGIHAARYGRHRSPRPAPTAAMRAVALSSPARSRSPVPD